MGKNALARCSTLFVLAAGALPAASGAPTYQVGQTGTFGLPVSDGWGYGGVTQYINSSDDKFSQRFTAQENLTVDAAWQFYADVAGSPTARIGIQGDDGTGNPTGTFLGAPSAAFAPNGIQSQSFAAVNLVAGQVYHLVTEPVAVAPGEQFDVRSSAGFVPHRPFDRATDAMFKTVINPDNSGWSAANSNPWFALSNGGSVVEGPGQTYHFASPYPLTQGDGGAAGGQRFRITDKEIPDGQSIKVTSVNFAATTINVTDPSHTLLLRFRDAANPSTVLGTAVMTPAQASGTFQDFALDQPVILEEGVAYLFTTEFGVAGTTADQYYSPYMYQATFGETGWGGATFGVMVSSAGGNNWSTFAASFTQFDLAFSFQGLVLPEPGSAVVIAMLVGSMLARRPYRR